MKKILEVLIALTLIACVKTEQTENRRMSNVNKTEKQVLGKYKLKVPIRYGGKQKDTLLSNDFGKYSAFFAKSDYKILLSLAKVPHMNYRSASLNILKKEGCGYKVMNDYDNIPHDFSFNGYSLKSLASEKHNSSFLEKWFGSYLKIKDGNGNQLRKRDMEDPDDPGEPQVPTEIHITSPNINLTQDGYPLCYYGDFVVRWNECTYNNDGIIIVVDWNGNMVFGEHYENTMIRAFDVVDDTGETTLNPHLFDDIPDTALCFLTVIRGSVEYDIEDETSYTFLVECSESIPFVLIRNITTINNT